MTHGEAVAFAQRWLQAWNERDREEMARPVAADASYANDFVAQVLPDSGGVVRGKEEILRFWDAALASYPRLHMQLDEVYVGADSLAMTYRNQDGGLGCTILFFEAGLIKDAYGLYSPTAGWTPLAKPTTPADREDP